ncbi:helix-turn-helix domain-containing protein [Saccharothrix xinjiangensis]|uniref:Helix-turn-helix domain-containing protein n=1 Tax=Saccharothrix xinjiangensis TaxID=204798 RepID=A0ABV9XZZ5_9PSEU
MTGRAPALLGAFDPTHRRLRITALARRAGLPSSTTHRLAAELVAWGGAAPRRQRLVQHRVAAVGAGRAGVPGVESPRGGDAVPEGPARGGGAPRAAGGTGAR